MAGRDGVGSEARRTLEQRGELQIAVAVRAGQGSPPGRILADEVRDDMLVELPLEVEDVVRYPDRGRHAPRVVQILNRAAAAERGVAVGPAGIVVELHRHTNHVVALLGEQRRRDG